ncbi:hypothetical protein [Companilactobacillus sp.]|uniref:hypothetical protein n=1 Tax=Companilactobacillus sp. TaxID=2767905 RepID=UPI002636FDC6|nr:hypothetical protein [Companilactobacillus sp.]
MKKIGITLLAGITLASFIPVQPNIVQAADTESTNTSEIGSKTKSVNEFFKKFKKVDADADAAFSLPAIKPYVGKKMSYNDFVTQVPFMRFSLFPDTSIQDSNELDGVTFSFSYSLMALDHSTGAGDYDSLVYQLTHPIEQGYSAIITGLSISADYNGQPIGSTGVTMSGPGRNESSPIFSQGVVTANDREITPLRGTSRGVAAHSQWFTDQYKINPFTGYPMYRISTSEWLVNPTFKPYGNSGITLTPVDYIPISTYTVQNRGRAGETVYKSNGDVYDFTLPNNSSWKVTGTAYDQFHVPYYQVSTDAWVRGNSNSFESY